MSAKQPHTLEAARLNALADLTQSLKATRDYCPFVHQSVINGANELRAYLELSPKPFLSQFLPVSCNPLALDDDRLDAIAQTGVAMGWARANEERAYSPDDIDDGLTLRVARFAMSDFRHAATRQKAIEISAKMKLPLSQYDRLDGAMFVGGREKILCQHFSGVRALPKMDVVGISASEILSHHPEIVAHRIASLK